MLGIPLLLSVALLFLTILIKWSFKNEDSKKENEIEEIMGPQESVSMVTEIDAFDFKVYNNVRSRVTVLPGGQQCAVCFAPTFNRCSRCKAVRYCSSKCQIAHWRQGHKYDCHPQDPIVSDRDDSSGNVDTVEQCERNANDAAEGMPMMNGRGAVNQVYHNFSDSHDTPRLSTVSVDSSEKTVGLNSPDEHEGPVLNIDTPKMVHKKGKSNKLDINRSLKSQSTGSGNSEKKLNKEKVRQIDGTKTRTSHSDLLPGFEKDNASKGAVLGDLQQSKLKEVSDVDLLLNDRQTHSRASKYGEVKSLVSRHPGNNFSAAKGGSSSSPVPPDGFKSSLQKVVQNLKTSHQKKPSLRNTSIDTLGKHSCKAAFEPEIFTRLYSSNEVELKPFGLINCGNSCYANAVLQCLAYTRPLTLYLLQGLHSKECLKKEWCFFCEFEHLIVKARKGRTPLSPVRVLSNITHLGHGREEDAHEFLRYAVDRMQSVCLEQAGISGPVAEETTLIGMTFGGYLHSKIKCMKCRNKSEKYEKMMDLTVEIGGDIRTLEQALKRFTASEVLEGDNKYLCSRCKSYEKAKKKLTVLQSPNILTIVLKRFQAGDFTKLNKPVRFPEVLNMTPYMSGSSDRFAQYSLYAVVVHLDVTNAAFSGHYVCYVRNYHEEWFKIDDSVVIGVDVKRVLSEEAYMLLYARHSPRLPALIGSAHDAKPSEMNLEAVPHRRSDIPKARHYSSDVNADPLVMQRQSSRNGHVRNPSYLEEWVTHSVESIPVMDSSSDVSSLFSHSEEGTCSTPSTKDSASVEDFSEYIFGRRGAGGG